MNRNHCAVSADLARYERQLDADAAREALIDRRTADYLLSDYAPDLPANTFEALLEVSVKLATSVARHMTEASKERNVSARAVYHQIVGKMVIDHINEYWEGLAREQAAYSVDSADCIHCYDQGCPRCNPEC